MKKASVLLDATSVTNRMKGVGKYAYQLWEELSISRPSDGELLVVVFDGQFDADRMPVSDQVMRIPYVNEYKLGMTVIHKLVRDHCVDCLIRPADKIGRKYGARTLTVCHDLNEWIWQQGPPRSLRRRFIDSIWERFRIQGLQKSDLVVCNSEFVRRGVTELFKINREKTTIGYCGVDSTLLSLAKDSTFKDTRLPESVGSYLLAFATGDPREGFEILPEVFRRVKDLGYTGRLVVAGVKSSADYSKILRSEFEKLGCLTDVFWIPFLGSNDMLQLAALYKHADFYLETSKHEGFGMQLVEAMACGTSCFSSGRGALDEVGAGFPLHLEVTSPQTAGAAIVEAWIQGQHQRDNSAQIAYASRFNWSETRRLVADFAWGKQIDSVEASGPARNG